MIAKLAAGQQPGADLRPAGLGQGDGGAADPRAPARARKASSWPISAAGMTPERMDVELFGEEGEGGRPARSASSSAPTAAPSTSTRWPTCRARPRAASCGCWSSSASAAWAATSDVQVDVRVVSSTSRDLREEIAAGRFREDLFHRLNVVPVQRAGPVRAARGHPRAGRILHRPDQRRHRHAPAQAGRRRAGHPAGARLAGQPAPAAQQRGADADPGLRRRRPSRSPPTCCRPRPWSPTRPAEPGRRADHRPAAARGARGVRARVPERPDAALLAATSRAPPPSSAWSARPCTAS